MQKKCADQNCDEMFETKGARLYCDLHAGTKKPKSTKKRKPKKEKPAEDEGGEEVEYCVSINLKESQLDRVWAAMTIEEKGLAVQTVFDSQEPEA